MPEGRRFPERKVIFGMEQIALKWGKFSSEIFFCPRGILFLVIEKFLRRENLSTGEQVVVRLCAP